MRLAFRLYPFLVLSLISGNLLAGAPDEVQAERPTKIVETVCNRKDVSRLQDRQVMDGHVVLDRLELDAPAVVRSGEDLKQLGDRDVKVVGRYVLYSKIFREFSEHMRFNFDQRAEGIHYRGIFQIPKDAPQDWAGILLEDGSLVFLFNPDDPRARRPLHEWKKLAGRKVAAYGEVRKQWGEWGKKLLLYGYADAYLDLNRIEAEP